MMAINLFGIKIGTVELILIIICCILLLVSKILNVIDESK